MADMRAMEGLMDPVDEDEKAAGAASRPVPPPNKTLPAPTSARLDPAQQTDPGPDIFFGRGGARQLPAQRGSLDGLDSLESRSRSRSMPGLVRSTSRSSSGASSPVLRGHSPAAPVVGTIGGSIHQGTQGSPRRSMQKAFSNSEAMNGHLFKVLVVGNAGVGKTSIIKRYAHDIFSEQYMSTIGVDFALKVIQMSDAQVIRLQLWDIAGQEQFGSMTRVYYKGAVGAFVVININDNEGVSSIRGWKDDIDDKVRLPNGDSIPVVLLGNKCDIQWEWTSEALDRICEREGFKCWYEVSAKENINIHTACNYLVRQMLQQVSRAGDNVSLHTVSEMQSGSIMVHTNNGEPKLGSIAEPSLDDNCCA